MRPAGPRGPCPLIEHAACGAACVITEGLRSSPEVCGRAGITKECARAPGPEGLQDTKNQARLPEYRLILVKYGPSGPVQD